jgi:hypothetical protein
MTQLTYTAPVFVVRILCDGNPLKITEEKFGDLMTEFSEETTTPTGVGRVDYKQDNNDGTFTILSWKSKSFKGHICECEEEADAYLLKLATIDFDAHGDVPQWFHTAADAQSYIDELNLENAE